MAAFQRRSEKATRACGVRHAGITPDVGSHRQPESDAGCGIARLDGDGSKAAGGNGLTGGYSQFFWSEAQHGV